MHIENLASRPNLELAWRRINTGTNNHYKRFFRPIYQSYELALKNNLSDLRQRLLGGTFKPSHPQRIYAPKASGLHRPLSLLTIEDQIVLQAFANLVAKKIAPKRAPLQLTTVYSNIVQEHGDIFFFRRWQHTYVAFQNRVAKLYKNGMRWVGDFDLAAFYDTISHNLLLRTIYPQTQNPDLDWFANCLHTWSADSHASGHGHGLPQGPLASALLAECFLLPVDLELQDTPGYVRYVDDVRLLGSSEYEVQKALIKLERRCRERGLIPQPGKFAIKKAQNLNDAMGILPSIADPQNDDTGPSTLDIDWAWEKLLESVDGKPYYVADKTKLRFVLFRSAPDTKILELVLRLVPRHPEHADAFFSYLGRCGYRKPIERLCLDLAFHNPYSYVRGEAWHILAKCLSKSSSVTRSQIHPLIASATQLARQTSLDNFNERWGACHFLCIAEQITGRRYSRHLQHQSPFVQALLAPVLPEKAFTRRNIVSSYLRQKTPEPGLAISPLLHANDLKLSNFGVKTNHIPSVVANTLRELGVIAKRKTRIDPIKDLLNSRYGISKHKSWHKLLGAEYGHALGLLRLAEASFYMNRSFWLITQNGFNQIIFLALQHHLAALQHPAACTIYDRHNQLVDFGVTLDPNNTFSQNCPIISACFRDLNARRNHVPIAHPYEKRTTARSIHVTAKERDALVRRLRTAYSSFLHYMP